MSNLARGLAVVAAVFLSLPAPVLAQEAPRIFQPTGPWTADFGDDYCRLLRTFSDGRDTVSISFEKIDTGPTMRLLVLGDAVAVFSSSSEIGIGFLPSGEELRRPYAWSTVADGQQLLIFSNMSLATPGQAGDQATGDATQAEQDAAELVGAAAVTAIGFGSGLTGPVRIETGSLRNAVEVLQSCGYDLLSSWGLDGDKHRTLSRRAMPPPEPILADGTIPFGEYPALAGNSNMVRVMVDASGAPTACAIHFATLSEGVNTRLCSQVMANAGFTPALDAEGQPIASYWTAAPVALLGPPPGR